MNITAALAPGRGEPFAIEEVQLEEPRADEVLVRLVGAGLCHTDLVFRDIFPWPVPAVLGHEGAGVVERTGSAVAKVRPGDHVVLTYASCGRCGNCLSGQPTYCDAFGPLNFSGARPDGSSPLSRGGKPVAGAFFGQSSLATMAVANERNVVRVRDDAPLELLGPLGCGVQTGAGTVLNSLRPPVGASLAVFGTGSVGLSALMAAHVAGCTPLIAVDVKPSRLALARDLGATAAVNAAEEDVVAAIRERTGGRGADFIVDTTAVPAMVRTGVAALAPRGTCALLGATPPGAEASFPLDGFLSGRSIRGILEGDSIPDLFIPLLVDLFLAGRFPLDRLVTTYPLAEINRAAAESEAGTSIKPVLLMK